MRNGSIIQKYQPLDVNKVPDELVNRNLQREELGRCIEPLLQDSERKPQNVLLHGPPGSGKTAMAEYVVSQLKKRMHVEDMQVNCFSSKTRFDILYQLLDKKLSVPRQGTSTEAVKDKLDEKIKSNDAVIFIDEVDQIQSEDVLYDVLRYVDVPLVMTANDPQTFAYFEDRIQSRLTDRTNIHMPRYTEKELLDILSLRADKALEKNTYTTDNLELIAEKAEGDARKAINTLKNAAQNTGTQLRKEIILDAVDTAEKQDPTKSLDSLNRHQQALYHILKDEDQALQIGEILKQYREKTEEPRSRKTIQRYLQKMADYSFIEKNGKKSNTTYSIS